MTDEELKDLHIRIRVGGWQRDVDRAFAEIDRLRAENQRLVERVRDLVMWLENRGYDHVADELRAAIEGKRCE